MTQVDKNERLAPRRCHRSGSRMVALMIFVAIMALLEISGPVASRVWARESAVSSALERIHSKLEINGPEYLGELSGISPLASSVLEMQLPLLRPCCALGDADGAAARQGSVYVIKQLGLSQLELVQLSANSTPVEEELAEHYCSVAEGLKSPSRLSALRCSVRSCSQVTAQHTSTERTLGIRGN